MSKVSLLDNYRLRTEVVDREILVQIKHNYPGEVEKIKRVTKVFRNGTDTVAGYLLRCAGIQEQYPDPKTGIIGHRSVKPDFWVYCIFLSDIGFPGRGMTFGKPEMMRHICLEAMAAWISQNTAP